MKRHPRRDAPTAAPVGDDLRALAEKLSRLREPSKSFDQAGDIGDGCVAHGHGIYTLREQPQAVYLCVDDDAGRGPYRRMVNTDNARDLNAIGQRIVLLRRALGYGPTEFAVFLDIGTNTLSNYETGRRRPDIDQAVNIVRRTGVTLDWLYRGEAAGLPHGLLVKINAALDRGEMAG